MKRAVDMLQNMDEAREQRATYNAVNRVVATNPDVIQRVSQAIAYIEDGDLLKVALQKANIGRAMFVSALSGQRELATRLARAQEVSADFLVDEAIDAARNEPDVMRARVIAENNRWAASRRNSKKYGDRLDLNVSAALDIRSVIAEANQRRLRPVSDQQLIEDAQVVDATVLSLPKPPDSQSEIVDPGPEPDIFAAPTPAPAQAPTDEDVPDIFS